MTLCCVVVAPSARSASGCIKVACLYAKHPRVSLMSSASRRARRTESRLRGRRHVVAQPARAPVRAAPPPSEAAASAESKAFEKDARQVWQVLHLAASAMLVPRPNATPSRDRKAFAFLLMDMAMSFLTRCYDVCFQHYVKYRRTHALDPDCTWTRDDYEAFVYNLHCAATADAHRNQPEAYVPPPLADVQQKYRAEATKWFSTATVCDIESLNARIPRFGVACPACVRGLPARNDYAGRPWAAPVESATKQT